jgi:hypothetical protein
MVVKPTQQQLFLLNLLYKQYGTVIMPLTGKGGIKQFVFLSYSYDNKVLSAKPQDNPNQNNDNYKGYQVFQNLVKRGFVQIAPKMLNIQYYKISDLGLSFIQENATNNPIQQTISE